MQRYFDCSGELCLPSRCVSGLAQACAAREGKVCCKGESPRLRKESWKLLCLYDSRLGNLLDSAVHLAASRHMRAVRGFGWDDRHSSEVWSTSSEAPEDTLSCLEIEDWATRVINGFWNCFVARPIRSFFYAGLDRGLDLAYM